MKQLYESDIPALIESDPWMMRVLECAEALDLPDWWIGAGFLRNKIWDYLEGIPSTPPRDIDLVYFNPADTRPETDWQYDATMRSKYPFAEWEVRNQARMHTKNNLPPFTSSQDGIAHWVETATSIAVKKNGSALTFLYCHGSDDLLSLVARPIPFYAAPGQYDVFATRIASKKWRERWPHLTVIEASAD